MNRQKESERTAKALIACVESGKDPESLIRSFINAGTLSRSMTDQDIKAWCNMARELANLKNKTA